MIPKIQDRTVALSVSLLDAMKQMDRLGVKILFVFSGERFEGLLTIGDIQRALIKGVPMSESPAFWTKTRFMRGRAIPRKPYGRKCAASVRRPCRCWTRRAI